MERLCSGVAVRFDVVWLARHAPRDDTNRDVGGGLARYLEISFGRDVEVVETAGSLLKRFATVQRRCV